MEDLDRKLNEQDGKEIFATIFTLFVFTAVAFQYQNLNLLPQTQLAVVSSVGQVQSLSNASANSNVENFQLQVQQLLAEINKLKAELAKQGGQSSISAACHSFERNLRIGDRGSDISVLQKVLRAEGFGINDADNVFDESTASAVVGLQEKYRNEVLTPNNLSRGTGFVGMSTRAKLNALYRCSGQNINTSTTQNSTQSGTVSATGVMPPTDTTSAVPVIPVTPAVSTTQSSGGSDASKATAHAIGGYATGPHLFWVYGQRETIPFAGSKLIVTFADGTSVTTTMPNLAWPKSTTNINTTNSSVVL